MSVRIEVTDLETGEKEESVVVDNDYFVLCTCDCYVDGIQTYPMKGTHVLTIKDVRPQTSDAEQIEEDQGAAAVSYPQSVTVSRPVAAGLLEFCRAPNTPAEIEAVDTLILAMGLDPK